MSGPLAALLDRLRERRQLAYWKKRARRYGARSVLNLGHSDAEVEAVTQRQLDILFPLLKAELSGSERVVLDYGCGPGRFTGALAELTGGRAIGVDPIETLLALAPQHPRVEYRQLHGMRIPLDDCSVDLIWVSIVLGMIASERMLRRSAAELVRVLQPGGLLFLVEVTAERQDQPQINFRSAAAYQNLFAGQSLRHVADYEDLGERVSVLVGRKRPHV